MSTTREALIARARTIEASQLTDLRLRADWRLVKDLADALEAEQAERRHDCEVWAAEGLGCAQCNPAAIGLREAWEADPIRRGRDAALVRAEQAEAELAAFRTREQQLREALECVWQWATEDRIFSTSDPIPCAVNAAVEAALAPAAEPQS